MKDTERTHKRIVGYKYRLWCPDCYGQDPDGCFGGGTELSEETYHTIDEADDAGWERTRGTIWAYDVVGVDAEGHVIAEANPDWLIPFGRPDEPVPDEKARADWRNLPQ